MRTFLPRRRSWAGALLASALLALSGLALSPSPSGAAVTPGYPTAIAQYGASARSWPYFYQPGTSSSTYWGYVLHNPGASSGNQTVSVMCWYDGDWATGNYSTNRWFKVLVYESYDGYPTPRWLFVHASYVYNQPVVRQCYRTSTGVW